MITLLVVLAVIGGLAILFAHGRDHAGSSNVIDRDTQRVRLELDAILSRTVPQ